MRSKYLLASAVAAVGLLLSCSGNAARVPGSVNHAGSIETGNVVQEPVSETRRWSTRLRDGFVGKFFGRADRHGRRKENQRYLAETSRIVSQYVGDVVLRFTLKSAEETRALAEASNILLLDVWLTTKTHVDIRIAEADVCFLKPFHVDSRFSCIVIFLLIEFTDSNLAGPFTVFYAALSCPLNPRLEPNC